MKKILILLLLGCTLVPVHLQVVNWGGLDSNEHHIIHAKVGLDNGFVWGVGYGYKFNAKIPIIVNVEYSSPFGKNIVDDFQSRIGGQFRVYSIKNVHFTVKLYGVFRRYENPLVTLLNFGSDLSATIGYYRKRWYVAAECGFDKAIITHFQHSAYVMENYPQIKNGWTQPATGGIFNFGINAGFTIKRNDIYLRMGGRILQDFSSFPSFPFYLNVGYNYKFLSPRKMRKK